jgi:hypothetical protein
MYFISKNNSKEGPYTLEEVLAMRLTDDILVWKEGISWSNISELPEFKNIVIKTPPLLPHEIRKKEIAENYKNRNLLRKEKARSILHETFIYGLIVALIVTAVVANMAENNYGDAKYHIFHAPGHETFGDFFKDLFLPTFLIVEAIALVIAGIRIAILKPEETEFINSTVTIPKKTLIKYETDKGLITISQKHSKEINVNDEAFIESTKEIDSSILDYSNIPAPGGEYILIEGFQKHSVMYNYYISVENGVIKFINSKSGGQYSAIDLDR